MHLCISLVWKGMRVSIFSYIEHVLVAHAEHVYVVLLDSFLSVNVCTCANIPMFLYTNMV